MKLAGYLEQNYKIFVDTCSLLDNPVAINKIFSDVQIDLKKYNTKINVPLSVISEVEKHCNNASNLRLRSKAKRTYRLLGEWQRQGIIEICGNKDENIFFCRLRFFGSIHTFENSK